MARGFGTSGLGGDGQSVSQRDAWSNVMDGDGMLRRAPQDIAGSERGSGSGREMIETVITGSDGATAEKQLENLGDRGEGERFALRPKKRKVNEHSLSAVARNFFVRSDTEDKVVCQICGITLTWKTGTSSTGLRNHLERKHYEQWVKRSGGLKPEYPRRAFTPAVGSDRMAGVDTVPGEAPNGRKLVLASAPLQIDLFGHIHPYVGARSRSHDGRRSRLLERWPQLNRTLTLHGVDLIDLRTALLRSATKDFIRRVHLERLARKAISYEVEPAASNPGSDETLEPVALREKVIRGLESDGLVEVILTRPTVTVSGDFDRPVSFSFQPMHHAGELCSAVVGTKRGVLLNTRIGRRTATELEIELLEFCLDGLDLGSVAKLPPDVCLEAADLIIASAELSVVGLGPDTTLKAVDHVLQNDLLGASVVAVVTSSSVGAEQSTLPVRLQELMCVVSKNLVVLSGSVVWRGSESSLVVDEYRRSESDVSTYDKVAEGVELSKFLNAKGFEIVTVTVEGTSGETGALYRTGEESIICSSEDVARVLIQCPHFRSSIDVVNLGELGDLTRCLGPIFDRLK